MKNMKYGRTLLALALVLVVLGSVVGGTIAWFTDEVTSTSNVIKSGTLDVTFEYAEEYADDPDAVQWRNADSAAIFDYKYWEPGYTQVRYVKVANVGDLAFKYDMNEILASTSMDASKASAFLASVIAKASRVSTKDAKEYIRGFMESGDLTKEENDRICKLLDKYSKYR